MTGVFYSPVLPKQGMHPALRYAVSLTVGLLVTATAVEVASEDHLLAMSLFPLYVTVTSMVVTHRRAFVALNRAAAPARKRAAIVGGVGALTGMFLLQASIPAGIAGFGLLFLGMATVVADFEDL